MSSNEGFFEIQAEDTEKLISITETHPAVDSVIKEKEVVLVYLKSDLSATELNQFLFSQNITLNHLVKRKNSLEEQFLELTNNASIKNK